MKRGFGLYSIPAAADMPPEIQMLRLASGHVAAQAVYTFAVLGVADILDEGVKTLGELAERSNADPSALRRLLRFLATVDVVTEVDASSYSLTALGRTLRSRPSSAVRDNTLVMGSPCYWSSVGGLLRNVQTGGTACEHLHGITFFEYLAAHPREAAAFDAAMDSASRSAVAAIVAAYDFSGARQIVDVGGGRGALLQAVLAKNPAARGVLFDSQAVIEQAVLGAAAAQRVQKVPGSFFADVPSGGDVYVLRRILHDWSDEKASEILRRCRAAMPAGSKLLVIELAAPGGGHARNDWAGLDLLVMVLMGGRERTEQELAQLLAAAGFHTTRVVATSSPYWIVEAEPR